jgi:hypothetical protein
MWARWDSTVRTLRLDESVVVVGFFEDVGGGAGLEGLAGEGGVVLHGQHDDCGGGGVVADLGDLFQGGLVAHVEVEDEDVGADGADFAQGVLDGAGFGDDFEVGLGL